VREPVFIIITIIIIIIIIIMIIIISEQEQRLLRGKTLECVSLVALAVGRELFLPDAREAS
jgi:hypothetical protein